MENNLGQIVLVKDINSGIDNGFPDSSNPRNLVEFKDRLYFSASDGENGSELWVSDGTTTGTQLLKDIYPGISNFGNAYSSYLSNLTEFKDKLYFRANDGENGSELWVSDGTTTGTQLFVNIRPNTSNDDFFNGSAPRNLVEFEDRLYFAADDGENGRELWVSDGTTEGTQLVVDIDPGSGFTNSSYPQSLTQLNNKLYFSADDGENGRELWVSDGTATGTQLVKDIFPGTGTNILDDSPFANSSYPNDLKQFDGKLYFSADDGENGRELWVSDGTRTGTQLLKDIHPGTSNYGYIESSNPRDLTEFDGKLYFSATDDENGRELWVSDGTKEGTQLVKDIRPGNDNYGDAAGSYPNDLTEFNGKLYFSADDGENGRELWVSDGTTTGTQLVTDIRPNQNIYNDDANSSNPRYLTVVGNQLYFSADNGETGIELFKLTVDDVSTKIEGTNGSDNLVGSEDADVIAGLSGNDTLNGGNGNDTLNGGNGRDSLLGGAGNDLLDGGDDNDILNGGAGNDELLGNSGGDFLVGGAGDDFLDGGSGNDTIAGGMGSDRFFLEDRSGIDRIVDYVDGSDSLVLADGLSFDRLNIIQGNDTTEIRLEGNNKLLTTLAFVSADTIDEDDFIVAE